MVGEKDQINTGKVHVEGFPSTQLLITYYSIGALAALLMTFSLNLSSGQMSLCLGISWLLTLGALALSLAAEREAEEDDDIE